MGGGGRRGFRDRTLSFLRLCLMSQDDEEREMTLRICVNTLQLLGCVVMFLSRTSKPSLYPGGSRFSSQPGNTFHMFHLFNTPTYTRGRTRREECPRYVLKYLNVSYHDHFKVSATSRPPEV